MMKEIDLQLLQKIKYCELGENIFKVLFYVFFAMSIIYFVVKKVYAAFRHIGKNKKRREKRKEINQIISMIIILVIGSIVYHFDISVFAQELPGVGDSKLSVEYKEVLYIESKERSPENVNKKLQHDMEEITSSANEVFMGKNNKIDLYIRDEDFDSDDIRVELYQIEYNDLKEQKQRKISEEFEWEEEDIDLYHCSIRFLSDGHYKFKIYYEEDVEKEIWAEKNSETERCVNDGYYESPLCTIDTEVPIIKELFSNQNPVRKIGERQYFTDVPAIIIRIEEENFNKIDFSLQGSMFLANGQNMEAAFQKLKRKIKDLQWKVYYKNGKRINETSIQLETEANYLLEMGCIDGTGQAGEISELRVTYDHQKPTIIYTGRDNQSGDLIFKAEESADGKKSLLKFRKYHFFRYFSKERISINIQARDEVSGVEKIGYVFSSQDKEKEGLNNKVKIITREVTKEDAEDAVGDLVKKDVSLLAVTVKPEEENFKGILSVYGQDYCSNVGANIKSKGMISESEKLHEEMSNITIKIPPTDFTDKENSINYYSEKVPIYITFEDKCSGLYKTSTKGSIEDYSSGKTETDIVEDMEMWDGEAITYRKKRIVLLEPDEIRKKDKNQLITIKAQLEDNAGNISEKVLNTKIVLDNIKPDIQVTYDSSNEQDYYNCSRKAIVKVKEQNFNSNYVQWNIQGSNKNYRIGEWKSEQDEYFCEVFFDEEGEDYAVNLSVTDNAGNKAEWKDRSYFTIDKTVPRVFMNLEKKDVIDESESKEVLKVQNESKDISIPTYFNEKQTVLIRIQEKNFDESKIEYDIQAINGNKKITVEEPVKYIKKGEEYYGKLLLDQEASYQIGIRCTDKAGNQSEQKQLPEFVIDTTIPEVIVQGVKNNEIYQGKSIIPKIICRDKYLDSESVKVSMIRANGSRVPKNEWNYERIEGEKEIQYAWENLPRYKNEDGIYELLIKGRDKAGNNINSSQKVIFRVNRRGAKFIFEDELKKKIEEKYLKEEPDIVLRERCVSRTNSTVTLLKDNEDRRVLGKKKVGNKRNNNIGEEGGILKSNKLQNLKVEKGYILKEKVISDKKSAQFGWYEKNYNIEKNNFSEEGDYRVTVQSDLKKFNLHFIVDKTSPVVNIGNLEKQQYDEKEHEFTINAMDNYGLEKLELYIEEGGGKYLGGKVRKRTITAEDLERSPIVKEKLMKSTGYQTVRYIAWDKAGNITDSDKNGDTRRCLVTDNKVLKKYNKSEKNYIPEVISGVAVISVIGYEVIGRYRGKKRIL